jgi:ABC-2 type transport system ATP-binding protein
VATREVGDMLRRLAADGHAVLLSSHRLDEVADVCSKVVALVGGTVRFDGSPADLAADRAGSMEAIVRLLTQDPEL